MGRVMPVVSVSWKASVPMEARATCPTTATTGTESIWAVAIPVTRFVAPGPDVAQHTPTRAGYAGVAVGGVGGALLVTSEDVLQLRVLGKRLVEGEDCSAGKTKDLYDALTYQAFAQQL